MLGCTRGSCLPSCCTCAPQPHLVAIEPNIKVEVSEQELPGVRLAVSGRLVFCLANEAPHWQVVIKEHLQHTHAQVPGIYVPV